MRVVVLLSLLGRVAAAAEPPLVVFHAPVGSPPEVLAAREALAQVARAEGTTLVDLSPSEAPAPSAAADVRRGIEAYGAFRWEEALQALEKGIAEARTTGAAGLSPRELSDLFLYRGLSHLQRGDTMRSWDDFVRAATIDPTRRLDPLVFPPRTVESFQRAVTTVQGSQRGSLIVDVPETCRVDVDARTLPAREATGLPYGEHYLRVECPASLPVGQVVTLSQSTQVVRPDVKLHPPPKDDVVRALAQQRGAVHVIYAQVGLAGPGGPTLTLRLLGSVKGQAFASPAEAPAALRTLIAKVVRPPRVPLVPTRTLVREPERRWYEEPWAWATGSGVVVLAASAAVYLIWLDDDPVTSLRVAPEREPMR